MTEIAFVRKAFPRPEDRPDDGRVEQFGFAAGLGKESRMQSDTQDVHLTNPGRVLRHQEGWLVDLETQGMTGANDHITLSAPADEKSAGNIDGDDLIARSIEMFDELGGHPL